MSTSAYSAIQPAECGSQLLLLPGIVGFYFAARLCITYLFFQPDPQTGAIVNFALNLLLLVAVVFYSFGPGSSSLSSTLRVPPFCWVLGFLAFGCCSLFWSATVSVVIAFAYWSEMAVQVVMIVLLLRIGPVEGTSRAVMKGYLWGACLIALVAWLSPTMQDLRPGNDDFFSPNAIGFTCAFGVFLAQYLIPSEKSWRIVAAFLAITVLRTLSKTTIIAFVIGETFHLLRNRSMSRGRKITLVLIALLVIAAFWGLIGDYYQIYLNAGNQAETLTGRIGIWTFVLERSLEQPWIGHGFHSFRNVIPPFGDFEAWHAHNELLQQFYTYGAVGILMSIGIYGSFYRQVRRLLSPSTRTLFFSLLLFIVVRGLADTENFDLSLPLWFISLISLTLAHSEDMRLSGRSHPNQHAMELSFPGKTCRP